MSDWQTLTLPLSYLEEIVTSEGIESGNLDITESIIVTEAKVDLEKEVVILTVCINTETIH